MPTQEERYYRPVVNIQDNVGKVVGRRQPPKPVNVQYMAADIFSMNGYPVSPGKGVYRFKTFEEADQWNKEMNQARAKIAAGTIVEKNHESQ